jgi:hypothetical protein
MGNALTEHAVVALVTLHLGMIGAVFILHVAILKHYLASEGRIFRFHVAIFLLLPILTISGVLVLGWRIIPLDVLTLYGLSAFYSLSFLELWSLSQGSYSLQILAAIQSGVPVDVVKRVSAVGQMKQTDRMSGIVRLGLARHCGDRLVITGKGSLVAFVSRFFAGAAGARLRE